ncbi:MAG: L,D-transpeptidase family protein [Candidatus Eiseniibacteriota bacterium]
MRIRIRWWKLLPVGAVLGAAGAAAYPILQGHTDPAFPALDVARREIAKAREAGASQWAEEALEEAEAKVRAANAEHRRQEVRFLPFRDYRVVRGLIEEAVAACARARSAAIDAERHAQGSAERAIAEAQEMVQVCEEFARVMPFEKSDRSDFQLARVAVDEAKLLHRQDHHDAALERATQALELARDVSEGVVAQASRYRDEKLIRQWRTWIDETVAWSKKTGETVVIVDKDGHQVTLYEGGRVVKRYEADMGSNSATEKSMSGDRATPEGRYRIVEKKDRGRSIYYKALLLDYPNEEDRAWFERAKELGHVPRRATAGGLIEIHGDGGRGEDWTRGCVALSNDDMDDVFARVALGTRVTIVGGNGKDGRLATLVARFADEVATK